MIFITAQLLSVNVFADDTEVDVSVNKVMAGRIEKWAATDVTSPGPVLFSLIFENNGSVDVNISAFVSIKKDGRTVDDIVLAQNTTVGLYSKDLGFEWVPVETGDFVARATVSMTNNELGQANQTSATTAFTVWSRPSGGVPVAAAPRASASHVWSQIAAGETAKMTITKEEIGITEIVIEVREQASHVKLTVTKLDKKPASVVHEVAGKVYQYIQIDKENLEDANVKSASVKFKVPKSWIRDNNLSQETIALNRYTAEWAKLPTTQTGEDDKFVLYNALIQGFSTFAITGEVKVVEVPPEEKAVPEEAAEEVPTKEIEEIQTKPIRLYLLLFLISLLTSWVLAYKYRYKIRYFYRKCHFKLYCHYIYHYYKYYRYHKLKKKLKEHRRRERKSAGQSPAFILVL